MNNDNKKITLSLIRATDILLSVSLLITLFPLLVVIAIIIFFSTGRPVIFAQTRVGREKKEFTMYKFRSMHYAGSDYIGGREGMVEGNSTAFDDYKRTEKNDVRITREGKWLRKLHLDELPQLWNVVVSEMSLVGPRPDAPVQELACDRFRWDKRHQVRPGITGLAQISPNPYYSNDERINYDIMWVEKISWSLYLSVLLRTFKTLIFNKVENY